MKKRHTSRSVRDITTKEYIDDLGTLHRYAIEMQGVEKRPELSAMLASVHPKIAQGGSVAEKKPELKIANPPPTLNIFEPDRKAPPVNPRRLVRSWWAERIGKEQRISVPSLAREAMLEFGENPEFVAAFWDAYGYDVMYDIGIAMLAERRVVHDGEGGLIEEAQSWFERGDGAHVSLGAATDEEWDYLLKEREEDIEVAQGKLTLLKEIRSGKKAVGLRGTVWDARDDAPPKISVVYDGEPEPWYSPPAPIYEDYERPVPKGQFWSETDTWGNPHVLVLHCPICAFDYNHHSSPIEYSRPREDGPTEATIRGEVVMPEHPNPSSRRTAIGIPMEGECGHTWTMFVVQHKGQTYLWTDVEDAP